MTPYGALGQAGQSAAHPPSGQAECANPRNRKPQTRPRKSVAKEADQNREKKRKKTKKNEKKRKNKFKINFATNKTLTFLTSVQYFVRL